MKIGANVLKRGYIIVVACNRGARKLTGESLKLVWDKFSTISWGCIHLCAHTTTSIVENSAQVSPVSQSLSMM